MVGRSIANTGHPHTAYDRKLLCKVGAVCGIIARMDEENQAFVIEMDLLNRFLRARKIPQTLCIKLRDYVQFRWSERRARGANASDVMHSMSADLAAQVYTITHVPILRQLCCFSSTSTAFLASLCSKLEAHMFSPEDMIIRAGKPVDRMHIIERGFCMRNAKVLRQYDVVGEEMLISGKSSKIGVICLSHVMTLSIKLESFKAVLLDFPSMTPTIRRNVVRDVLMHGVKDWLKAIDAGIAVMFRNNEEMTPAEFEQKFTSIQLQTLYDIKLYTRLADQSARTRLELVVRNLQYVAKRRYCTRKVLAELEKQAGCHPAVLVMERELQAHGLEGHLKALLNDDHDSWTLSKCMPGEIASAYSIPMGTAVRLLHSLRCNLISAADEADGMTLPRKCSNSIIARHVATAVVLLYQIAQDRARLRHTGAHVDEAERRLRMQRWALAMVNSHWKKHMVKSSDRRCKARFFMSVAGSTARPSRRDAWLSRLLGSKVHPDKTAQGGATCSSATQSVARLSEFEAFNTGAESTGQVSGVGAPEDVPVAMLDEAFTAEDMYTDVCMSHRSINVARNQRSLGYCRTSSEGLSEDLSESYSGQSSAGMARGQLSM